MNRIQAFSTVLLLALALPAQQGEAKKGDTTQKKGSTSGDVQGGVQGGVGGDVTGGPPPDPRRVIPGGPGFNRAGLVDKNGNPISAEAAERMLEVQRDGAGSPPPPSGGPILGDHMYTASVSVRPRRLAPGQSGTLNIIVMLADGDHVLKPGSRATVEFELTDEPFDIGKVELDPPRGAVYDETLVFRAPITIRAKADKREHVVPGKIHLGLHTKGGRDLGVFWAQLQGKIVIGEPLPQNAFRKVERHAGPADTVPTPGSRPPAPKAGPVGEASRRDETAPGGHLAGGASDATEEDGAEAGATAGSPQVVADSLLLWGGGGVLLLLVVLLITRRK